MDRLYVDQVKKMFLAATELILEKEPYLTEIDSMIGDGDHGEGMARGCRAVKKRLETDSYDFVDDLCYAVSTELIKTMGGASGVLFGTMFLGGISLLEHREYTTAKELAEYFQAGECSVERRGKASPGQKTMLDALYPACVAMKETAAKTTRIEDLFRNGFQAAVKGAEESKNMRSRTGRSKNFKDKTLGIPDPGAVSVSFWFQGFDKAINTEGK